MCIYESSPLNIFSWNSEYFVIVFHEKRIKGQNYLYTIENIALLPSIIFWRKKCLHLLKRGPDFPQIYQFSNWAFDMDKKPLNCPTFPLIHFITMTTSKIKGWIRIIPHPPEKNIRNPIKTAHPLCDTTN